MEGVNTDFLSYFLTVCRKHEKIDIFLEYYLLNLATKKTLSMLK